jgi:hypothetical protein
VPGPPGESYTWVGDSVSSIAPDFHGNLIAEIGSQTRVIGPVAGKPPISHNENLIVTDEGIAIAETEGGIVAHSLETGALVWTLPTVGRPVATTVDGRVVA